MPRERTRFEQLIREVFGNAKGEELLAVWDQLYVNRLSYQEGVSTEEFFLREGEKRFVLLIKAILQEDTNG